jgi:hypothetical protein
MVIVCEGITKTTREVEKMLEGHYRLCRLKTWFLRRCIVDNNRVTKFREVVTHGGVESDFALFD